MGKPEDDNQSIDTVSYRSWDDRSEEDPDKEVDANLGLLGLYLQEHNDQESLGDRMGRLSQQGILDDYYDILHDSEASNWLFSTILQKLAMRAVFPSVKIDIREKVLSSLAAERRDTPRQKVSRHRNPPVSIAHFGVQWDPVKFLSDVSRGSSSDNKDLLSQIITVTGDGDIFQALPCQDYMTRTWHFPESKVPLLTLLSGLLKDPQHSHRGKRSRPILYTLMVQSNNLSVRAVSSRCDDWLEVQPLTEGRLQISVKGTKYDIAELAEQLAWLGSALRVPEDQEQVWTCHAELSKVHLESESTEDEISFNMCFYQTLLPVNEQELSSNQCWRGLFRRLTIARGFPVSSRPKGLYGLDIPLGIVTQILGGWQINLSNSQLLIKGFGNMLVPTKTYPNSTYQISTIAWHFLESQCGLHIPCAVDESVRQLRSEHLGTAQSIVGWCEKVRNVTGMSNKGACHITNSQQQEIFERVYATISAFCGNKCCFGN